MLSPLELTAACTAGIGGVSMFWNNVKSILARAQSLIIVTADLDGYLLQDFMDYAWDNFKCSRFGARKFSNYDQFIKPKNRVGRVSCEVEGKLMTFWDGYKPIFISLSTDANGIHQGSTRLSFIRGTFDLEDLFIKAASRRDHLMHEKHAETSRYYVKKCFGKKSSTQKSNKGEPSQDQAELASSSQPSTMLLGVRPLFWKKEELGIPIQNKPFDNLAYSPNVLEFYDEVKRWKDSKQWFLDKGLPWRFGAGLFGIPGTGKSSLARAIGQSLDLPIHCYDLTTMDNQELTEQWQRSLGESPCIVLFEDVDRVFNKDKSIKTAQDKAPLTLDCLLNCISGVQPADGILVIVTANDVTKLDPALGVPDETGKSTRPGRLDRAVYVDILDEAGRYKIANRILSDNLELVDETVRLGKGETGAQFESRCSKLALEHYWGKPKVYGIKSIAFETEENKKMIVN
jgi:hypothetical protein